MKAVFDSKPTSGYDDEIVNRELQRSLSRRAHIAVARVPAIELDSQCHNHAYAIIGDYLWRPTVDVCEPIGRLHTYPMAINNASTSLAKASSPSIRHAAVVCEIDKDWALAIDKFELYGTDLNDAGAVVGAVVLDGYEKPCLVAQGGRTTWLPYFHDHWCRPNAVNNPGDIVGTATTDHGSHALLWRAPNKS